VKRGSYWLIRPTMVNKNVSHVITVTTNCQGISQSSRDRDSSTCSQRIISSGLLTFFSGSNDYNCNCFSPFSQNAAVQESVVHLNFISCFKCCLRRCRLRPLLLFRHFPQFSHIKSFSEAWKDVSLLAHQTNHGEQKRITCNYCNHKLSGNITELTRQRFFHMFGEDYIFRTEPIAPPFHKMLLCKNQWYI
jgi:hypothetical protein